MDAVPSPGQHEDSPGLGLAATLGLIALCFLPLMNGGYSSGGAFQVAFVLLPLAAGLAWINCPQRPRAFTFNLLLLYCAAGLALMAFMSQGGREIWYYVLAVPAAWIVTWVTLRHVPDRAGYLWPVVTGSAVLTGLYGWFLWLGSGQVNYQLTSVFGLHNSFAGYLLLAWPAALVAAAGSKRALWRWLYGAAALFLAVTLVLTYSRAAWVVMALQLVALGAWAIWSIRGLGRETGRLLAVFGGGIVAAACGLLALPGVRDALGRLFDFQGYSFQGRLRFWEAALQMFSDSPLGVGLGNYGYAYPQYQKDYIYFSIDPHSWPLQLLSELGIAGALIAAGVIIGTAWWIRRVWRATGGSAAAILLIIAVAGSLMHAALDFDYYFGAITALMGVLLAYGAHLAAPVEAEGASAGTAASDRRGRAVERLRAMVLMVLLLFAAGAGELLTLERYQLDHLRDNPGLSPQRQVQLLTQAQSYNRFNAKTHYQLASILAAPGLLRDVEAAREEVELCLALMPGGYAPGLALKGLLSEDKAEGNALLEQALELDPYNYPEHYFYYANLAADDAAKRERLLLGLERIPAHEPIRPDHVRPTWHKLNPLWAQWYFELARLADTDEERTLYRKRGASFQAYWESVLAERGEDGE